MIRPPAFQFFVNDWLSSLKITMMTPAEEGAYIRLLCYAWADPDVSIPDDDETLARISRLGEQWLKGSSTTLRACFVPHPKKSGRLVNARLLQEHKRQQQWRAKCRAGGIQSGKTRAWELKGSSRVVEVKANRTVEVNGNSSSSSSVNSSKKRKYILPETCSGKNGHFPGFDIFWAAYPRKE
ncbi:YdaU family protein, partial [Nitrospiraceae bacterium AH_259_D15_M11_P09]|nr:YdaU family protein [Nitrospiraceae bacterium AH_259_D15_M11_P09]